MTGQEYDYEPVPGLPARLPNGEHIIWQGSPDWWALARTVFHIRILAIYFAAVMAWHGYGTYADGGMIGESIGAALWVLPVATAGIGVLCLLAYCMAHTTIYTITEQRVVLRYGVALPMAVNVPYTSIVSAGLDTCRDGTGSIALNIGTDHQLGYFRLWPHARPYWVGSPQPLLRAIPDAERVAGLLAEQLSASLQASANENNPSSAMRKPDRTTATSGSHQEPGLAIAARG